METSGFVEEGANGIFESPLFDAGDGTCIRLYYHMYGKHIGQLNLYQLDNGKWTKLCSVVGSQVMDLYF